MNRTSACWAAAAILSAALAGCDVVETDDSEASDEPAISAEPAVTDEEIRARQERIRAYFDDRLQRLDIVATTVTESGQVLDWIWPESQASDGFLAAPPDDLPLEESRQADDDVEPPESEPPALKGEPLRTELQLEPEARGPEGTVPVARFDVQQYLALVGIPPEDPLDVISKVPPPAPASNDRYYGVTQRFGTFFGTGAFISIWDTPGPDADETSIAQTAVISGTPMQAIEAGKLEHKGAPNPAFFVYFRTNGTASGDWVGGYNKDVDGWTQVSPRVHPAAVLGPVSSADGTEYELQVDVRLYEGNWWVGAFGEWAGYYPHCKGGDAPPCDDGTLFTSSGIRDEASRLDWYGEVFDDSAPAATSTDMGSGAFAAEGFGQAAYFRNMYEVIDPTHYQWWDTSLAVNHATDPSCYSVGGPWRSIIDSWRNWFFYGGPGKEGEGCN